LVKETGKRAGNEAAKLAEQAGKDVEEARRGAAELFRGLRFHDLRRQAITEMAEAGASGATIMAVAGHLDRAMWSTTATSAWRPSAMFWAGWKAG
jgi:integrase